jgi:prevent-host-death family protein
LERLPVTEARASISDVVNRVYYQKQRIVLTRQGKDIAAIIPIEDLQQIDKSISVADAGQDSAEIPTKKQLDDVKKELGLL